MDSLLLRIDFDPAYFTADRLTRFVRGTLEGLGGFSGYGQPPRPAPVVTVVPPPADAAEA